MLRVGRVVLLGKRDRIAKAPTERQPGNVARMEAIIRRQRELLRQGDGIIARQYDALVKAEGERDLARSSMRECHELLLEQQVALDALSERYQSLLRHPVTGTQPEEGAA